MGAALPLLNLGVDALSYSSGARLVSMLGNLEAGFKIYLASLVTELSKRGPGNCQVVQSVRALGLVSSLLQLRLGR